MIPAFTFSFMAFFKRPASFFNFAYLTTRLNGRRKSHARRLFSSLHQKLPKLTHIIDCDEDSFFRYTAGRWLWNEPEQLAQRYVRFEMNELARIAAGCFGSSVCTEIEKLPEGNFNKTFLLTFENGSQAVARIPNPNAGRAQFSTASEVATMDFARNILQIPAPKILAWSSNASANPVQSEYIIMEKVTGKELSHVWDDLSGRQKFEIVKQLVSFESRFSSSRFTKFGSLYYSKVFPELSSPDQPLFIDQHGVSQHSPRFAVGPTNSRVFFDDGRGEVDIDRGPWNTAEQYAVATAYREIACINKYKTFPRPQGIFSGPGQYKPTATAKLSALDKYLKVAKYLLPRDKNLHSAILWHGDLHTDNIFVDSDDPTKIVGIIDWQSAHVSPLFLQARHPALLDFEGSIPESFDIKLPEDFETLSSEEQEKAKRLRSAQSLYKLYDIASFKSNRDIYEAIRLRETLGAQITGLAGSIFSDGEPLVHSMLATVRSKWMEIIGPNSMVDVECPLVFSDKEMKKIDGNEALWKDGVELMDVLRQEIGAYAGWDGWVNHDDYEPMKEKVRECCERYLLEMAKTDAEQEDWRRVFPFPVV